LLGLLYHCLSRLSLADTLMRALVVKGMTRIWVCHAPP
jgi:hypothetical protein